MAEDKGQSGVGEEDSRESNDASKKKQNEAADVWKKIQKSSSEEKTKVKSDLDTDVLKNDVVEGEKPKRKRRRRRRKKKDVEAVEAVVDRVNPWEGEGATPVPPVESEVVPEPVVEPEATPVPAVEPEVVPEPVVEPEATPVLAVEPEVVPEPVVDEAPTVPANPFNPFATSAPAAPVAEEPVAQPMMPVAPPAPTVFEEPVAPIPPVPEEPVVEPPAPVPESNPDFEASPSNPFLSEEKTENAFNDGVYVGEDVESDSPEEIEQAQEHEEDRSDELKAEVVSDKSNDPEVIDVGGESEEINEELESFVDHEIEELDGFKSEVWDILRQAGITKKRLTWGCSIILIIVIGLFVSMFGGIDFLFSSNDSQDSQDSTDRVEVVEEVGGADEVDSAYILGEGELAREGNIDGILTSFELGEAFALSFDEEYIQYVELLRSMQNIYSTDVYALLDLRIDRRVAIESHLVEMSNLIEEGLLVYDVLGIQMEEMDAEFDALAIQRDAFEEAYFSAAQNLEGQNSFANLNSFIEAEQLGVELKAKFSAYSTLRDMFANSLNALRPRFTDISANKDAVIKGVRVFDIIDSDINAIIRLE